MKLLDLFCGGGGAGAGYYWAGFDVTGVDLAPQPFYPFDYRQGDSLALDYEYLAQFDAIHASPPCQAYSAGSALARSRGKEYPDLFHATKSMLIASGLPYIIENVVGSPAHGIGLCGSMFGLGVRRHRIFESNIPLVLPPSPCVCSAHRGEYITVAGSQFAKGEGARAMGINWAIDKYQLKEAIPPVYTEFLGLQMIAYLETKNNRRLDSVSGNDHAQLLISVSHERRSIPVNRACLTCGTPLPDGTSRLKFCNGYCRLKYFRARTRPTCKTNQTGLS